MLEPLTVAIALSTVIATKVLEKTGENVGQLVWDKSTQFINNLKKFAPNTATALSLAPEQPLDYGQAVLEVETVAKNNQELARNINELKEAAEAEPHPKITEIYQQIKEELEKQKPSIQNYNQAKLQEKGFINQGNIERIENLDFSN